MKGSRLAHMLVCLVLFLLFAECADRSEVKKENRNLVLITVDTLRADHLGCYGYPRDTSPFFDALAKDGVIFKNALVQWPKTQPSLASILSSTYPSEETTMHTMFQGLPESLTLVSEVLKNENFRTMAVVSNYNVGKTFRYDQGFDIFVESWLSEYMRRTGNKDFRNTPGFVKEFTNAATVTEQAINLLKKYGSQNRFFLWIHYMDPHGPYIPPKSYGKYFPDWASGAAIRVKDIPSYQQQVKPGTNEVITDPEFYKVQYDREIRYWDDEFKRLISFMKDEGLYEKTVFAVTADHGESLGEHDYFFEHGNQPYQPCGRVPLLVLAPEWKCLPRNVVDEPVPLMDLIPTLLGLLDIPLTQDMRGKTLLPTLCKTEKSVERPIFSMAGSNMPHQKVAVLGEWKLVHVPSETDRQIMKGREYELYNLKDDPNEQRNLIDEVPEKAEILKKALIHWEQNQKEMPLQTEKQLEHDEFSVEMLKSLGYLQ